MRFQEFTGIGSDAIHLNVRRIVIVRSAAGGDSPATGGALIMTLDDDYSVVHAADVVVRVLDIPMPGFTPIGGSVPIWFNPAYVSAVRRTHDAAANTLLVTARGNFAITEDAAAVANVLSIISGNRVRGGAEEDPAA